MNLKEMPLMTQFEMLKKKHPDSTLLFRIGNFYEAFREDAVALSEICDIKLIGDGTPDSVYLAGFKQDELDIHLKRLMRAGKRVAICEQREDPKLSGKLVKRGISEPMRK